jgi:RNA polymerase sigma-70 factor, ECF subfamily
MTPMDAVVDRRDMTDRTTAGSGAVPDPRDPSHDSPRTATETSDAALVGRLRGGDESAFAEIVKGWSGLMLRVARLHVATEASAEEVVQETWMAVIRGLPRFEGRSSLRTWVFRILTNLAKTRGVREARSVPMSALSGADDSGPTVDPDRFRAADDQYPHNWTLLGKPRPWEPTPEDSALAGEIRAELAKALALLPDRQRVVVSLRDIQGLTSDEVCGVLDVSAANQRVLLHRGRAKLRGVLEDYYRHNSEGVTS